MAGGIIEKIVLSIYWTLLRIILVLLLFFALISLLTYLIIMGDKAATIPMKKVQIATLNITRTENVKVTEPATDKTMRVPADQ